MRIARLILPITVAGSLVLNAIFGGVFGTYAYNHGGWDYIRARLHLAPPVAVAHIRPDVAQRELFRDVPKVPGQYIFMGDSLTQAGPWVDFFPGLPVQNRGIGGSTVTDGVNLVADGVLSGQPAKLFVEYGYNDYGAGTTAEGLILEYNRLLDAVHAASPHTKVYLESTVPGRGSPNDRASRDLVLDGNARLRDLAAARGCTFIDVYPHLALDFDSRLPADMTLDGVHLTLKAYLAWIDVLRPYVLEPLPTTRP